MSLVYIGMSGRGEVAVLVSFSTHVSKQVSECLWPEGFQPKGNVCVVQQI